MDISRVIVIGAGVMGSGIAQTLAVAGCDVTCCDVDEEQIDLAWRLVEAGRYGLRRAVELGKLTDEEAVAARDRVRFSLDAEAAVADCDLVLEAGLFATYDKLAPAHALLASNTSGLPIGVLADATERPGQVIGWHWASPAPVMPLAEIVVTPVTDEATTAAIVDLAESCGKNRTDADGVRWAIPGDHGRPEADGTITLLGRGSRCINTGGEKVFPEEVETAVKSHPAIVEAVVVGLPDERFGQRVTAVVVLAVDTTLSVGELQEHLRPRLAGYKLPRTLVTVDRIRYTGPGKPDHMWAREAAAAS